MYLYRRSGQNWTFVELFVVTALRQLLRHRLCIRLCSGRPEPQFRRTLADALSTMGLRTRVMRSEITRECSGERNGTRSQTVSAELSSSFHSWFEPLFEPGQCRLPVLSKLQKELHLTNPRSLKLSQIEPINSRIRARPCRNPRSASKAASIKRDFHRSPRIFVRHMIAFVFSEQPMRQAAFCLLGNG